MAYDATRQQVVLWGGFNGVSINGTPMGTWVWDGTNWAIKPTLTPGTGAQLSGVSCTWRDQCEAVGSYYNDSGVEVTLAEHYAVPS